MDLFRRYLHWNDNTDIEKFDVVHWWQERVYQPLGVFGVVITTFNDELRHATMLEF